MLLCLYFIGYYVALYTVFEIHSAQNKVVYMRVSKAHGGMKFILYTHS